MISAIIISFLLGALFSGIIVGAAAVDLGIKIGREEAEDDMK